MSTTRTFAVQYIATATGSGKTGLSDVTADVWQLTRANPPVATRIVTARAATEIAGGIYAVGVASMDPNTYDYLAIFTTADTTVAQKDIPAAQPLLGAELTTSERDAVAAALLKLDFSGITGEANRSALNALRKLMNRWAISSNTLTVYKEDDSSSAYTQTVTAAPGADPISSLDTN